MKKISQEADKVREANQNFFVLEKYNNDIKESMLKMYSILEAEAKKLNVPVSEYADAISKISK